MSQEVLVYKLTDGVNTFTYSQHSADRIRERGLSHDMLNYYFKNGLFVKCFEDDKETHFVAFISEMSDYYLLVVNSKINEVVTCMQLKYAGRCNCVSRHFKTEAYELSMGLR